MTTALRDIPAIFVAALEHVTLEDRAKYLDQACGSDSLARQRVEMLLRAHADAGNFLGGGQSATPAAAQIAPGLLGLQIGPYKLLDQIGEGGFGVVFMAEQLEPLRRQVALKVIKPGMDTRQVIARFEAERQALAMMDHPNIAKVFDAGATESQPGGLSPGSLISAGRPYFVMELVRGIPITKYCDEHQLTLKQRLELFLPVCHAVQHAHQKGIIHRDLKPSNVLVALYDDKPVPKVIDFGVAKAAQKLTERTMFTEFGQVVGTLEYMSPEQARLNELDIDTRSDIYSLGVLLYELLSGCTPFDGKRLRSAAFDEMLRIIREEDPPKPSTRLSSADTLPSIAANRNVEPARLNHTIRGELDWIVMKTLEKDRNRRYETASGFAADVQRYLAGEPVQACPPSVMYRSRKFVLRNKGPVLAVGLLLLSLIAGIVGTTTGMTRARQSAAAERLARQQAEKDKDRAEKRLSQIEKGNEILTSIFTRLNPDADQKDGQPLRAALGEQLALAAVQLKGEATGDPLVVARLQVKLGQAMLGLDMAELAIGQLTEARATLTSHLGSDDPDTLDSMRRLAWAYHRASKWDLALPLAEEMLERTKARLKPDDPQTLNSINCLANVYVNTGRPELGVPLLEEALRLHKVISGSGHRDTIASMINLAGAYRGAGKLDLAISQFEEGLKLSKAQLPPDHPHRLLSMCQLAAAYEAADKLDLAMPLYEESVQLAKASAGPNHRRTLWSMVQLANAYQMAGKPDLALPLAREVVAAAEKRRAWDERETERILLALKVPGAQQEP